MRLLSWTSIFLCNTLVSAIPLATKCHQLRIPFVPSPENLENGVRSSLSIDWSIRNGSLYANEDQVYPPSVTRQLRAPLFEGADQSRPRDKSMEVSYTLDTRPLPEITPGSVVRVRFEFLDLHGNLVSPNAVAVDLLTYQNGDHDITRLRVQPARGGGDEDQFTQTSQPWVVKFWRTQFGSIFDKMKHHSIPATEPSSQGEALKDTSSDAAAGLKSPFSIASFGAPATPAYPYHRSGHRPHDDHRPKKSFLQIIRPIILPAVLGTAAGLAACVVGFFVGHLLMSLVIRLGWQGKSGSRSQSSSSEEGWASEKFPMLPHVYVTIVPESNA